MYKNFRNEQQRDDSRRLLEAKINDKYTFAVTKNKITNTDFLNSQEKHYAEKYIKENKIENYMFFGGNGENSERNILLFFPEKFSIQMIQKNLKKIISCFRIKLPNNFNYEYKNYLSGIMKLGVKREKVGDILIRENGADIIVLNEILPFLQTNLHLLTRFNKAKFEIIDINEVETKPKEFEHFTVIVSSMRLDSFVSELAKCSRNMALEIINQQRVLLNYEIELKSSKKIENSDVITIRGKGKFIVENIDHKTKFDKLVVNIKKYI